MRFKIDFGRVVPGLLVLLLGLILLVVLVLVAVVAFLFSFLPGWGTLPGTILQVMLVPAALIVAGVITILTGVTWWGKGGEGWFTGIARRRAFEDPISLGETAAEVVGVAVAVLVFLFLYENQLRGVAFFTPAFGSLEQFLFYAPMFVGMAVTIARAIYGRRNAIRPFDALNSLFIAVSASWLLSVFPFDFSHFKDLFPSSIQPAFGWLNNDIGRLLFALVVIGSLVSFIYTLVLYSSVRSQMHARSRG
ncbi:MAG TPA: hypothetical protein VLY21_00795 [Nitrososphaerales archaeon]|nr:hypothetical protein [Nitrososphaerales archaeon]